MVPWVAWEANKISENIVSKTILIVQNAQQNFLDMALF